MGSNTRVILRVVLYVFLLFMDSHKQRVIDDFKFSEKLGIFRYDFHKLLFVVSSALEFLFLAQEVKIFQRDRIVSRNPLRESGFPSLQRTLQIISGIDFQRRAKDVVHNAEVNLLLHLILLPVKDDLVQSINSGDQRIWVLNRKVVIV